MFERFTEKARVVVKDAQDEARKRHHTEIDSLHVLYALATSQGVAEFVLDELGVRIEDLDSMFALPGGEVTVGQIPFTDECKKMLELSLREALSLGHNYVGTEHLLLGIVRDPDGPGARALIALDCDAETVRNAIIKKLTGPLRERGGDRPSAPLRAFSLFKAMMASGYVPTMIGGSVVHLSIRRNRSPGIETWSAESLEDFISVAKDNGAEFAFSTVTGPTFTFNA